MISKRLSTIANMIDDNSKVLDIGCDHSYLAIYLCKNKNNIEVTSSDINEKSLDKALMSITKENLDDKISLALKDGLDAYTNQDVVVIAGMGGKSIISIIEKKIKVIDTINSFVLCPNSDEYLVRKYLYSINYYIKEEILVLDKGYYYPVMKFNKGNKKTSYIKLKYGSFIKNELSKNYYSKKLYSIKKAILKIPISEKDKINKLKKEVNNLEKLI